MHENINRVMAEIRLQRKKVIEYSYYPKRVNKPAEAKGWKVKKNSLERKFHSG
jgi:hypothetical protein